MMTEGKTGLFVLVIILLITAIIGICACIKSNGEVK